jgi:hypothetical protein
MTQTAARKLMYSIAEVAEMTGIGRTVLFREMAQGCLASVAIGQRGRAAGRRLITHDDLVAWIALHRTAAA